MKKTIITLLMLVFATSNLVAVQAKIEESSEAQGVIVNANALQSMEEKVNYLVLKGNEFIDNQKYQEAKDVADYILTQLNDSSEDAQDLLEKAQENLEAGVVADEGAVSVE